MLSQASIRSCFQVTIGLAVVSLMMGAAYASDDQDAANAEQLNTFCEDVPLLMSMLQKAPELIGDPNQMFPITAQYIKELTAILSACDTSNVTQTCLGFFSAAENFTPITWSYALLSACGSCLL